MHCYSVQVSLNEQNRYLADYALVGVSRVYHRPSELLMSTHSQRHYALARIRDLPRRVGVRKEYFAASGTSIWPFPQKLRTLGIRLAAICIARYEVGGK